MRLRRIIWVIILGLCGVLLLQISMIIQSLSQDTQDIGSIRIMDRSGAILALLPRTGGYSVTFSGTYDPRLISSIISIEDRRFYRHHGVDIIGKISAIRDNLESNTARGGSTITEQYIKNTYFRDAPRTVLQKMRESLWAMILETRVSKDEIMKRYLDTVYMGNTIYGVGTALMVYFPDESSDSLRDSTILEIITRLRYPNLSPQSASYLRLISEKLHLGNPSIALEERERPKKINRFPLLTERILSERKSYCEKKPSKLEYFVRDALTYDLCTSRDIMITSSVDMAATEHALGSLESILTPLEAKNVHNGAIIAIDPKTRKYLIYVGNRKESKQNAIDMIRVRRSVGSTLKPFLYLMAFHSGIDPDDLILDTEKIYRTENAQVSYISENYNPKPYGPVTLRAALGNSLNNATVRLTEYIGVNHVALGLRSLGFPVESGGYYGYGIMLGAIELSLEEVITGYTNLTDLDDTENYLIYDILSDNLNRSMTFGASSILNTSIPLAIKTGTSTDFRDNWAIGYDSDIIIGVWVGNADRSSMDDVSGVTGAGPIYHMVAEDLIERGYIRSNHIKMPESLARTTLCLDNACMQKQIRSTRAGYTRSSRIASHIYRVSDFATPLTDKEKEEWNIQ